MLPIPAGIVAFRPKGEAGEGDFDSNERDRGGLSSTAGTLTSDSVAVLPAGPGEGDLADAPDCSPVTTLDPPKIEGFPNNGGGVFAGVVDWVDWAPDAFS